MSELLRRIVLQQEDRTSVRGKAKRNFKAEQTIIFESVSDKKTKKRGSNLMHTMNFTEEEKRAFKQAKFEQFPDGDYQGMLIDTSFKAVGGDKKKFCLTYNILEPKALSGTLHVQYLNLDPSGFKFVKAVIGKFGVNTDTLELDELVTAMKSKTGSIVTFSLKTEGRFQNFYISKIEGSDLVLESK